MSDLLRTGQNLEKVTIIDENIANTGWIEVLPNSSASLLTLKDCRINTKTMKALLTAISSSNIELHFESLHETFSMKGNFIHHIEITSYRNHIIHPMACMTICQIAPRCITILPFGIHMLYHTTYAMMYYCLPPQQQIFQPAPNMQFMQFQQYMMAQNVGNQQQANVLFANVPSGHVWPTNQLQS